MSEASPSPPPRRRAVWYWLPVLLYIAVMQYFSSAPDPYANIGEGTTLTDIFGHFLGFAVLTALVLRWFRFRMEGRDGGVLLYTLVFCLVYAILDEVHQIPIPGRSFEWLDLATDFLGVVLVVAIIPVYRTIRWGQR